MCVCYGLSSAALSVSVPHSAPTSCVQCGCVKNPSDNPRATVPSPDTSLSHLCNLLAKQAVMLLGLRRSPRFARSSHQVVSDNPILYHMMSLDPHSPRFLSLLGEFLESGKELKNLKKADDERVLKPTNFLYEVSIASHP